MIKINKCIFANYFIIIVNCIDPINMAGENCERKISEITYDSEKCHYSCLVCVVKKGTEYGNCKLC